MLYFSFEPLSRGYACNFLLARAMQFPEIIALPSHIKISMCSMSCVGMQTCRKIETLNIVAIFLLGNFGGTPCRQVAIFSARCQHNSFLKLHCFTEHLYHRKEGNTTHSLLLLYDMSTFRFGNADSHSQINF